MRSTTGRLFFSLPPFSFPAQPTNPSFLQEEEEEEEEEEVARYSYNFRHRH